MSYQTIEAMFGKDERGELRCPLPKEARENLLGAVQVLLSTPSETREAVCALASFLVSSSADALMHDTTLDITEVKLCQGEKRGLDTLVAELETASLRETRHWLQPNYKEAE